MPNSTSQISNSPNPQIPNSRPPIMSQTSDLPPASPVRTSGAGEPEGCTTPKSEKHRLKPLAACPPAPRKPRPCSCRKRPLPRLFSVPRDLTLVFVAVAGTPAKKLRLSS